MKRIIRYACGIIFPALVATATTPAVAGWEVFAAQLESLGWTVIEEADGSLRLHPPPAGSSASARITDVITVRGWNIAQEADGSLILTREREPGPAPAEPSEAAMPPGHGLLGPAAAARLESLGWGVERAEDGSVLLFPPGPVMEDESVLSGQNRELVAEPVAGPVAGPAPATDLRIMDEATIAQLRDRGWSVEYADDGSILLYPPSPAPAAAPVAEPAAETAAPATTVSTTAVTADFSDDAVLGLLEQRGWTVERAPDGSLLLYPRSYQIPSAKPAAAALPGACSGHTVAALATGRTTPPLEDLADVQAIAGAWVADAGVDGVGVGRIRQLFRIYVVSIVDAAPPHRLRHQIAIRRDDGKVILLD